MAGLGFGQAVLVPAFRAIPGVEVVAVAGRRHAKAQEISATLAIPLACATPAELVEQDIDAIALALPPALMADIAAQALARGLAVFAEKPIAVDVPAAEALEAAGRGKITAVDFEFAELRSFKALREIVNTSALGSIRHVDVEWTSLSYAQRHQLWSWKSDAREGGGVLCHLGAHVFHLLEWIFGPMTVDRARLSNAATARFSPTGRDAAEDEAEIALLLETGAKAAVRLSNSSPGETWHRWVVAGSSGTATLELLTPAAIARFRLTLVSSDGSSREIDRDESIPGTDDRLQPCQALIDRFVRAVRLGEPMQPDFGVGTRVQRLIDACRVSARSGSAAAHA